MRKTVSLIALLTLSAIAQAANSRIVTAPVDQLFIPSGFDNNDNIEVVVTGKFPNPCFIKNQVEVNVKGSKVLVKVTALQREVGIPASCPPIPVPFKEEITIGNLQGGKYQVIVNPGTEYALKEKLEVKVSTSGSVDDHYYAIVDHIDLGFTGGLGGSAILVASSPSSCLVFDRLEYLSNGKDTISVLPILKKISNRCIERNERFEVDLNYDLASFKSQKVLLFVRSMEGKAVNSLISR